MSTPAGYNAHHQGWFYHTDGSGPYIVDDMGNAVLAGFPARLFTDSYGANARLRVDSGQTGFFAGRMWRLSYEILALGAIPRVLRVTMPVNFIIHHQDLAVDSGGIHFEAFRSTQGTPGGTFNTPVSVWDVNFMTEHDPYAFVGSVDTGGTFTPSQEAVEHIRVRTANATAQQSTVSGNAFGERGLAAGTYYLVLSQLEGVSGDSSGVYTLIVEERP